MIMNKDFLWGGAVAANQYEGGYNEGNKGLSVTDVMSSGDVNHPREISFEIKKDNYYPNHFGIDFYHHYKEDIKLFAEMGEYSANGRPLVTAEKSTQYAGQVHLTKKLNTVGSPQLI